MIGESYLGHARKFVGGAVICAAILPASADAGFRQPLRFFEGRTEMQAVVKVIMKKPYRSKTLGQGRILGDGSLALLQEVYDEGQAPEQRRWKVKQVAPGRYSGTMTEALRREKAGPDGVRPSRRFTSNRRRRMPGSG